MEIGQGISLALGKQFNLHCILPVWLALPGGLLRCMIWVWTLECSEISQCPLVSRQAIGRIRLPRLETCLPLNIHIDHCWGMGRRHSLPLRPWSYLNPIRLFEHDLLIVWYRFRMDQDAWTAKVNRLIQTWLNPSGVLLSPHFSSSFSGLELRQRTSQQAIVAAASPSLDVTPSQFWQ